MYFWATGTFAVEEEISHEKKKYFTGPSKIFHNLTVALVFFIL